MNSLVWIENLGRDLRYAFRQLWYSSGFTAIATVTLALGIGANTAIFSVVNGLLFSSLHIQDESQMVEIGFRQQGNEWQPNLSVPEYRALREQTRGVFSQVIGDRYGLDGLTMAGSKPDRILTDYVTGDYFDSLGVRPLMGRFFRAPEGVTPGADPLIVISYGYWRQHFGSDPNVIGRRVALNGHPLTVIGVAPRSFRGVNPALAIQAYLPLAMEVPITNMPITDFNKDSNRGLRLYARLQTGVNRESADARLSIIARLLASAHPDTENGADIHAFPLSVGRNAGFDPSNTLGGIAAMFQGLAGLVLLLACGNVANLLLVRATVRERDMVVRLALGARRSRLIRQMLTESILLALFGGIGGMGLGFCGSSLLSSINLRTDLPIRFDLGFDWHVFVFSAAVALLAGVLVGLVPALRMARTNLNFVLREGGRGIAGGSNRFRNALVVVQVASAFILLIVAGLFTRSLSAGEHTSLGFNPDNVLTLAMDPAEIGYNDAQTRQFYGRLLEPIRALPGVKVATISGSTPMGIISDGSDTVSVPGHQTVPGQPEPSLLYNVIGTQFFETLQIPMIKGRSFADGDTESSPRVAIISEAMAKKYWLHQDPIGRQFTMDSDSGHPMQVVGVAGDARYQGIAGPVEPVFYVPFLQHSAQNSLQTLQVRTVGDPTEMVAAVEHTIDAMAPTLPIFEVRTLRQALYSPNGLLVYQIVAAVAGIVGTVGLILSVVGVYGVLSYVVTQKTGEIGVRIALGAQRGDILKIVFRQGFWILGIGLSIGLAGAFGASHLLRSMIVVSTTDLATYVSVTAIMAAIAILACYVPARRAMRVDPIQALRAE
ncbi:MAG: ABC transporter permease [Silvibacterium sp.]